MLSKSASLDLVVASFFFLYASCAQNLHHIFAHYLRHPQSGVQCRLTASTGLRVDRVVIATKCKQILCDVIHRRLTASLASENHERELEWQEYSQTPSIMSFEKNVRKKLVNVSALLFRATAPDVIPTRVRDMTLVYA